MTTHTIKFKRGIKSKLNELSYGEPAYISDENELYIGTKSGVEKLTSNKEVKELSSQLENIVNGVASRKTINVKDYGVMGDGVTNDSPKLRELADSIEDGSILYFPRGTYMLGDGSSSQEIAIKFSFKNNIKIKGDGRGETIIIAHPQTPAKIGMGLIWFWRCENVELEDIELDGNLQERNKHYGGTNWGDESTMNTCSNINIDGGYNINIRRVYSHHPAMDNCEIGRHGGGDTPNGNTALFEDCEFTYGYRQGISIVGWDNGVIRRCRITDTAKTINLLDASKTLGTSPKSNIDSETWGWNLNWVIDECYFANAYVNMNDGTKNFTFKNCTFENEGFSSETPSTGTRTFDVFIKDSTFKNSNFAIRHQGFNFENNEFIFNTETKRTSSFMSSTMDTVGLVGRAKFSTFKNNKIIFDYGDTAQSEVLNKISFIFNADNMTVDNNTFIDLPGSVQFGNLSPLKSVSANDNVFIKTSDYKKICAIKLYGDNSDSNLFKSKNIVDTYCYSIISHEIPKKIDKSFSFSLAAKQKATIKLFKLPNPLPDRFTTTLNVKQFLEGEKYGNYNNEGNNPSFVRYYTYNSTSTNSIPINIEQITNLNNSLIVPFLSNTYEEDGYLCISLTNLVTTRFSLRLDISVSIGCRTGLPSDFEGLIFEDCTLNMQKLDITIPTNFRLKGQKFSVGDEVIHEYGDAMVVYKCTKEGSADNPAYQTNPSITIGETTNIGTATFLVDRKYRSSEFENAKNFKIPKAMESNILKNKYSFVKLKAGDSYFDRTLGKQLYYQVSSAGRRYWTDAMGNEVVL